MPPAAPTPPTTPWQGARSLGLAAVLAVGFLLGLDAVRAEPATATLRQMERHVASLRAAELAHFDAMGHYVAFSPDDAAARARLGWTPPEAVDCRYAVTTDTTRFTIEMVCPSADGRERAWGYVRASDDGGPGLDGRLERCTGQGVLHAGGLSGRHRNVGGACDAASLPG